MLRGRILNVIESHKNPKEASLQVCLILEQILDLHGNGWFDGDDELEARLRGSAESESEG